MSETSPSGQTFSLYRRDWLARPQRTIYRRALLMVVEKCGMPWIRSRIIRVVANLSECDEDGQARTSKDIIA